MTMASAMIVIVMGVRVVSRRMCKGNEAFVDLLD